MSENKNMKLNDEAMAQASGGMTLGGEHGFPDIDATGTVIRYIGDLQYLVRLSDGAEITATFNERHIVSEGTAVNLKALDGGWEMFEDLDY